jgi:maltose-binding protein MalE
MIVNANSVTNMENINDKMAAELIDFAENEKKSYTDSEESSEVDAEEHDADESSSASNEAKRQRVSVRFIGASSDVFVGA